VPVKGFPAVAIWVNPHDEIATVGDRPVMSTVSYPVTWQERGTAVSVGRLRLECGALVFDGRDERDRRVWRTIRYDDLRALRLVVDDHESATGRVLLVETTAGQVLIRSAALHAEVLRELAGRIADLELLQERRAVVVVPLRPDAEQRAHELAAEGPPFDPSELPLVSHELLLTPGEAIFVFESPSHVALESILDALDVWAAAAKWSELVAGPPRIASVAYSWHRSPTLEGIGLGL
jgi:hypothetical protein